MPWLKKRKRTSPYPDPVRFPYGAETLEKSHESPYGTRPKQETTFPETIYPYESSSPSERHPNDLEYDTPSHAFPRRHFDYQSVWPVSCTQHHWLTK